MNEIIEIYNLKNDTNRIKVVQVNSLDNSSEFGYKIEDGLLFGSEQWFKAIDFGLIQKNVITGVISAVYMSGHDDHPEFEIENSSGKSILTRMGDDKAYTIGKNVELIYVKQKYKRPISAIGEISECIIQIKIYK